MRQRPRSSQDRLPTLFWFRAKLCDRQPDDVLKRYPARRDVRLGEFFPPQVGSRLHMEMWERNVAPAFRVPMVHQQFTAIAMSQRIGIVRHGNSIRRRRIRSDAKSDCCREKEGIIPGQPDGFNSAERELQRGTGRIFTRSIKLDRGDTVKRLLEGVAKGCSSVAGGSERHYGMGRSPDGLKSQTCITSKRSGSSSNAPALYSSRKALPLIPR